MRCFANAYLSTAFEQAQRLEGNVHSIFHHAINLAFVFPDQKIRLLTVLDADEALPDSLILSADGFESLSRLKPREPISWQDGTILAEGFKLHFNRDPWTGFLPPMALYPRAIIQAFESLGLLYSPALAPHYLLEAEDALIATGKSLLAGTPITGQNLLALLGLGQGLTPAFDDALVGLMAVICCKRSFPAFMSETDLMRTTDISAKYLRCAQEGYYSGRILSIFQAGESLPALTWAIKNAAMWGGSSGRDMLWGMMMMLKELLKEEL